jgi:zinc protease
MKWIVCLGLLPWIVAAPHAVQAQFDLESPLPFDPKTRLGTLPNGIRYYIRENAEPRERAELRLAVNVGSVLEAEDQRGLAHFVEHMAFNGTQNFASQELVDYLEGIGMRFGADINAYTNFDETMYRLTVPTDDEEVLSRAFLVLADWARGSTFVGEEIEKERGVVVEEWRGGRGAQQRIRDKQFPVLFKGSRYAERLPIGTKEVLESFEHETLVRFCRDWYRPELMAVVAVGDFDADRIEALIREQIGSIASSKELRERPLHPVPDHEGTLFAIATDPEATRSRITVYTKFPRREMSDVASLRQSIAERLFSSMLNSRLAELVQEADPPFINGWAFSSPLARSVEGYGLGAMVENNGIERGLQTVMTEVERAARHGFTQTELERGRKRLLSGIERQYNERDKTHSARYANSRVSHFLRGQPVTGIEYAFEAYQSLLPEISLNEINALAREWSVDHNRVVLVSGPEKEGVHIPGEQELLAVFAAVAASEIAPYVDETLASALVTQPPVPGEIVQRQEFAELDLQLWTLSNGARVYVKATDFKDDEIAMSAWSAGGISLATDAEYLSAYVSDWLIPAMGIGEFSAVQLQKHLAGKQAFVRPTLGELTQGLRGGARPQDLETLLQLLYLHFTAVRRDEDAYQGWVERFRGMLENRASNPNVAFGDTLRLLLSQHHPRSMPITTESLRQVDLDVALKFYNDRFANAGDFTFAFVGALDLEALEALVCSYIGGLPASDRHESWRDVGRRLPVGVVTNRFRRGVDPKSRTMIVFNGTFEWTREQRYAIESLVEALRIRAREVLREDLGGTYGVRVSASKSQHPRAEYQLQIGFGCDPQRLDELTAQLFALIEEIRGQGVATEEVTKIAEIQRENREVSLRQNGFWTGQIQYRDQNDLDLHKILELEELVQKLDSRLIRDAARRYLRSDNYVQVSMDPEMDSEADAEVEGNGGG